MSGEVTEAAPLPAPVVTAVKDSSGDDLSLDTFDNPLPVNTETPKAKEKSPDTDSLETQTDEFDKKEEKPKDEKKEDEVKEENKTPEEPEKKPISSRKTIKAVDGEDSYELNQDMQLRLKIGDKYEMVPLSDIKEHYADALQVVAKAQDIQAQEVKFRAELQEYQKERTEIVDHFTKIGKILDDPESNPLDALNYLLDLTGRNRYEFSKKVLEKQLDELDMLQSMDEVERAKYFLEKENAYLKEKQEISRTTLTERLETEKFIDEISKKRDAAGISEDQFVGAYNDLVTMGNNENSITPDQVIAYAASLPIVMRAESLIKKVDSDLVDDDELVLQLAEYLKENSGAIDEEIIALIEAELGMKKEVKQLNKKVAPIDKGNYGSSSKKSMESDDFETFDDLDVYNRR